MYRPQYFELHELVCPHVYRVWGEKAWMYLDEKGLITIDWLRRTIGKSMTINDWYEGGTFDQRGLRCILCDIVKEKSDKGELYVSAHLLGKGYDADIKGLTAEEVRLWLSKNKDKLPYNIRVEKGVKWLHIDVYDTGNKITFINP